MHGTALQGRNGDAQLPVCLQDSRSQQFEASCNLHERSIELSKQGNLMVSMEFNGLRVPVGTSTMAAEPKMLIQSGPVGQQTELSKVCTSSWAA